MRVRTASLLLAAVLPAAVLTGCGSSHPKPKAAATPPKPATCPLTGQPAPGGKAPQRIALAVKIGNEPAARPQSGLDDADIVFEEPIEGAITRLLAVYQCRDSAKVGPVRSTRWIDDQLLPMFGHPAFGFAGGINPDEDLVRSSHLVDLNFTIASDAFHRSSDRTAPDNLFTSTAALWGKAGSGGPPSPVFSYSSAAPTGRAVSSVTVVYSSYYSSGWRWESGTWVWYVNGAANPDASGAPVTVTNVVILDVRTVPGPYVEDATGNHGVRSITIGSGPGLLLRGGRLVSITWSRSATNAPFVLRAGNAPATLSPGRTWVMLVPVNDKVNVG